MNETNAGALLAQEDIDGGLIGTASLRADTFLQIIEAAHEAAQTPQEERVPAQP
jgi:triosephosphate isomerase